MEILELFAFCILDPSQEYRYQIGRVDRLPPVVRALLGGRA